MRSEYQLKATPATYVAIATGSALLGKVDSVNKALSECKISMENQVILEPHSARGFSNKRNGNNINMRNSKSISDDDNDNDDDGDDDNEDDVRNGNQQHHSNHHKQGHLNKKHKQQYLSSMPGNQSSSSYNNGNAALKNTQKSAPLFLRLRNQEVERDCARIQEYMQTLMQTQHSNKAHVALKSLPNGLGFGHGVVSYPARNKPSYSHSSSASSTVKQSAVDQQVKNNLIDFDKLFARIVDHNVSNTSSTSKKSKQQSSLTNVSDTGSASLPLKLEVCSGHGDWLTSKAEREPNVHWVGLEMRYERVFQIWSKSFMKRLRNLSILHGEAHNILTNCIPSEIFEEVYVNFPDPPVWGGSTFRLVDNVFLQQVHRILKNNGTITCVTDDSGYALAMMKEFFKPDMVKLFTSAYGPTEALKTELPKDYGTSYFDRLWLNGGKSQRFFLKFVKL
jgi:tRNA G46 methylase TrmB